MLLQRFITECAPLYSPDPCPFDDSCFPVRALFGIHVHLYYNAVQDLLIGLNFQRGKFLPVFQDQTPSGQVLLVALEGLKGVKYLAWGSRGYRRQEIVRIQDFGGLVGVNWV